MIPTPVSPLEAARMQRRGAVPIDVRAPDECVRARVPARAPWTRPVAG